MMILTARDEKRGLEVVENLKACGLSDSASIASLADYIQNKFGKLDILNTANERAKKLLSEGDKLAEEKVNQFLKDVKEEMLETKGWPINLSAYVVFKAALNAYSKILATKFPNFRVNCVSPGFVKTDMNCNNGESDVEEGTKGPVALALTPAGGPSRFFDWMEISSF
ncbi:Salutaridine reductase [Camellia lanceoleosa]|uniref:Salutaridine reductase n=1 Tax=Camellia lanceoleosa TaxID=1840588 RepID=A0ACC0FL04_9ERIC|nr:Salutaridine reductase [Camellia lanceoleosa]